jgi:hypothetical protein
MVMVLEINTYDVKEYDLFYCCIPRTECQRRSGQQSDYRVTTVQQKCDQNVTKV